MANVTRTSVIKEGNHTHYDINADGTCVGTARRVKGGFSFQPNKAGLNAGLKEAVYETMRSLVWTVSQIKSA